MDEYINKVEQITSRVYLIFDPISINKFKNQKYMMLWNIGDNRDSNENDNKKNIKIQNLQVPSLESIINLMQEIDNYLNQNPLHYLVFLSLSSLSSSLSSIERGTLICLLYILHIGKFTDPSNLLTKNNIHQITIPSFIRYIYYYHHLLRNDIPICIKRYRLKFIRITTIPYYTNNISGGGCSPYIIIENIRNGNNEIIYNQKIANPDTIKSYKSSDELINMRFENIFIHLHGDICISFFNNECSSFMFKVCLHTAFVSNDKYLKFERKTIDYVYEDKDLDDFNMNRNHRIYHKDFCLEMFFSKAVDNLNNDNNTHER